MASQLIFQENNSESDYQATFVEVILPLALQQTYTYRIPADLFGSIKMGQRVIVQFGSKKIYTAIIGEIHHIPPKAYTAKYILDILDNEPIVNKTQLEFWKWIAEYYCCTLGEVMNAALPAYMKLESESRIMLPKEGIQENIELDQREEVIIMALQHRQELSIQDIAEMVNLKTVLPIIKSLYEKGLILVKEEVQEYYRPRKEIFVKHEFDLDSKEMVQELFNKLETAPRQSDLLLAYLQLQAQGKPIMRRHLLKVAHVQSSVLDALVQKKVFSLDEYEVDRINDIDSNGWEYTLNDEQEEALKAINEHFEKRNVVLLHGITSSGKTHLYMELMNQALEEGKQALYLVPEIALTAQLIQRLRNKYGKDIGIYHSKFTAEEKVEVWQKVANGTYKVVLGVRSALFLPFTNLGIMVIDEEHEHSFKQYEPAPRYHARDAGIYLMSLHAGKTILGSATPSFESYFNALRSKYGLVKMHRRFGDVQMPEILLSDLREEIKKKLMKSHFSSTLHDEMHKTLKKDGQVILFQNRRGYAPLLECTTCGWTPMCQNCDISLTYHQASREIICHYCGYKEPNPNKCKACGNHTLKMLGFGTEKIEDELQIFFPDYKSLRMDQDTTRGKNAYAKIINALEDGEAQILVGTQMVTKGLDFENVRLVGILNADQMLRYPDFRAVERSYQLMSQVSGRAGRRDIRGKVIIQTYNVQHSLFSFLLQHDYEGFYNAHIDERLEYKYPPFFKLIKLILRHENIEKVKESASWLAAKLKDVFGYRVLGPEFPPIPRIRNKYSMQIMLKFERQNLNMAEAKAVLMKEIDLFKNQKEFKGVRLIVDVDPY